jgi:hypothetical protein
MSARSRVTVVAGSDREQDGAGAAGGAGAKRRFPVPTPVVGGVVGAAVALGAVALIWGIGGGGGSPTVQGSGATTTTAGSGGALHGPALQLQHLLTAGNKVTYHATYSLTTTEPQAAGSSVAVEVWRQPPDERQDSSANIPGSPAQHQEALELHNNLVNCTQSGTGTWSCASEGNALPSGPDAIVRQITSSLAGDQVATRTATVANVAAECFDLTSASTKLSLCVDHEGIPVEVTDGTNTLELTELDHKVTKDVFTPPAPVSAASTTTSAST